MHPTDGLARLLNASHLERLVPQLAPETLHQLIRQGGLEATVELIALATPAQLAAVLDVDLWGHARSGHENRFDADRFGEWLEALADAGDGVAARIVAALDEQLVIAGLSQYVRVFDPGIFEPIAQSDDEAPARHQSMREGDSVRSSDAVHVARPHGRDPAATWLECEVGGYIVRARRGDAWDAVVSLLVALETEYPDRFGAVMQGCRLLSNSAPEIDGLDDLLSKTDQAFHELAVDREFRRSQQGYSSPADARAFLEMARRRQRSPSTSNPIAAAYFRAADDTTATEHAEGAHLRQQVGTTPIADQPMPIAREVLDDAEFLADAGLFPDRPRALLEGPRADSPRFARIQPLIDYLRDNDASAFLQRTRELAFLTNTLMVGCSVQSRPFTPQEASLAVVGICNLALEYWPARWPSDESTDDTPAVNAHTEMPSQFLLDHDLISAFEVGWMLLYQDVSLFVAEQLIATLRNLQCADRDIQDELNDLRRELATHHRAGTPSRARPALDAIAALDGPAWISLRGLLDECPVLPAALTATLERRTGAISPTAFEFISTTVQMEQVRAFMARLPDILSE